MGVGREELTDTVWARIEPLLPSADGRRGGRWRDHRQVINGISWRLRTGAPWRDVPEKYGPWKTLHERLRLDRGRYLGADLGPCAGQGRLDRDGGVVLLDRLDQCPGSPACCWCPEKGGCTTGWVEDLAVADEAIGRSRGGLTSKIHLATDGRGLPMSVTLTPGQAGDNPRPLPLPDQVSVKCDGLGRPRKRPDRVLADKAHSSSSTRQALRARGIQFTSPEKKDHAANRLRKGSAGGCPPVFDLEVYKGRNVVERCFNRFKQFRALATRFTKRAAYRRTELTLRDRPLAPRFTGHGLGPRVVGCLTVGGLR